MESLLREDWDRAKANKQPFVRLAAYSKNKKGQIKRIGRLLAPTKELGLRLAIENYGAHHSEITVKPNARSVGRSAKSRKKKRAEKHAQ